MASASQGPSVGPASVLDTLSTLEAHLLLALSTPCHLLVTLQPSSPSGSTFEQSQATSQIRATCDRIRLFCATRLQPTRSSHILAPPYPSSGNDDDNEDRIDVALTRVNDHLGITKDEFLQSCFFPTAKSDPSGLSGDSVVSEVVIVPNIEKLPLHSQTWLREALRDGSFTFKGNVYALPRGFVCIGLTTSSEQSEHGDLSRHLVDYYGLSLFVPAGMKALPSANQIPRLRIPLIPREPRLHRDTRLRIYASDLLSGLRHHPSVHAYLLTHCCPAEFLLSTAELWKKLKDARWSSHTTRTSTTRSASSGGEFQGKGGNLDGVHSDNDDTLMGGAPPSVEYSEIGEVRPIDIQEVLLSCVGHRIHIRHASDKLVTFWNTAPVTAADANPPTRRNETVEEVVQSVLQTV